MEMINEQVNGTTILKLSGTFDAYASTEVGSFFEKIPTEPLPYLIIDLSNVNFIDSTGLSTLVTGMKRCRLQHGELVLCGTQGSISSIFELTRLNKVFAMFGTQEEAIASVQNQQHG